LTEAVAADWQLTGLLAGFAADEGLLQGKAAWRMSGL